HSGARRQDQPELIRARRACAILRNLGEVARTYLCLDRERRVREGTRPAKSAGFSNLHSVGRIRMRPVTNRGLRRRRPPRTRATVTRIVSSPFPSLPTDTGGRYMSLSTWPIQSSPFPNGYPQYEYQTGSNTSPYKTSCSARTKRAGNGPNPGPCTMRAPTYRVPLGGFTAHSRMSGSHSPPW